MPVPSVGYTITDVNTLVGIGADDRTDGYTRLLLNDGSGNRFWVVFDTTATSGDFRPSDNPTTGWWKKLSSLSFSSQHTATSLAAGSNSNFDLNLGSAGIFTTIQSDKQAWLTVYISEAARTADNARLITADPQPSSGVLADIIFTGSSTVSLTPTVNYWASANVFFRLKNTGSTTQTIAVTINGVRFN